MIWFVKSGLLLTTLTHSLRIMQTPFWAAEQNRMYQRVLQDKLEFPDGMMFEAMDLLRGVSTN